MPGDGPWNDYAPAQQEAGPWEDYAPAAASDPLKTGAGMIGNAQGQATAAVKAPLDTAVQKRDEGQQGLSLLQKGFIGSPAPAPKDSIQALSNLKSSEKNYGEGLAGLYGSSAGGELIGEAIPTASHAGELLQKAMGGAKDVPIDVSAPGNSALHIRDLAGRGGSMPKVIRDFVSRATDPEKGPITYQEARDFYSNASRLSRDEMDRLTPVMKREIGQFTQSLGDSIRGAATKANVGPEYAGGMNEYRRAMGLREFADKAKQGVKDAIPYIAGGGVGSYILRHSMTK